MQTVTKKEAEEVFAFIEKKGFNFHFGKNGKTDLTKAQVLEQCKMYIAACRIGDRFGCDILGIQYQQGLKDLCPASDLVEGMLNSTDRPPAMYFPLGGSTLHGVAKPGEIVWSRVFIEDGKLKMDLDRAKVIELPEEETRRRLEETTPQWPIMHAVTYGVSRDQMMARHKANHINAAYADSAKQADNCLYAKAELARKLGMEVALCGTDAAGKKL